MSKVPHKTVLCLGAPDVRIFNGRPTRLVVWDDDPHALESLTNGVGGVSVAWLGGSLQDLEIFAQEQLRPDEVYTVCIHPKYGTREQQQARFNPFLERLSRALSQIDVRFATVSSRILPIVTNTIARLLWLERHFPQGFHTHLPNHRPDKSVVILGAGPSLNAEVINTLLAIPAAQRPLFWATNTAARLLPSDFPLDLILTIECADTSVCLGGWTHRADGPVLANDLMAHDLTWSVSAGGPMLPFAQHGGLFDETLDFLLQQSSMLRVPYGVNGLSALLGLSLSLRLPRVILVGADAAWSQGAVYSPLHPERRDWYVGPYQTLADRSLRAVVSRDDHIDQEYFRAGLAPLTRDQECIQLDTWGGDKVYAGHDLYAPIPWYERLAEGYGGSVEYLDASGPGAAMKRGWKPVDLKQLHWPVHNPTLPEYGCYTSAKGVERQWKNLVSRTRQAQRVLRSVLDKPDSKNRRLWKDWNALESRVPWLRTSGYVKLDMLRREADYMDPKDYCREVSKSALAETYRWLPGGDFYEAVEAT